MFQGPFDQSIIKHAKEKALVEINLIDRHFSLPKCSEETKKQSPESFRSGLLLFYRSQNFQMILPKPLQPKRAVAAA